MNLGACDGVREYHEVDVYYSGVRSNGLLRSRPAGSLRMVDKGFGVGVVWFSECVLGA